MKTLKSKPFLVLAIALIGFSMSGCGKSNGSATPLPPGGIYPQGGIPGVPGAPGSFVSNPGVIPGQLTFGGTIYVDSANICAGSFMQKPCMVSPGLQTSQFTGVLQGQNAYGDQIFIQSVQPAGPNLYNVSGYAMVSQGHIPYGYGYGQALTGQIVGINVGRNGSGVYGGYVAIQTQMGPIYLQF